MTDMVRVFVSHHHSDKEDAFTRRLVDDLTAAGADVWVDYRGATSESFVRKINEGMAGRQWLVLVMTPASVASEWVKLEVDTALAEVKAGRMLAVVPIVMQPTPVEAIPLLWRTLLRKDAIQGYAPARDELLAVLGLSAAPGATPPAAPAIPAATRYPLTVRLDALGYQGVNLNGAPVYIPPMITIPAGRFLMGSDRTLDSYARYGESPQYWVEVGAFQIAKYPVTVAEHALAIRAGAVREPPTPVHSRFLVAEYNTPDRETTWLAQQRDLEHPVVCVTLDDAMAYAAWLNIATSQPGWRLPTEAEWEKAARWDTQGQHSRVYPWGDVFDVNRCNSDQSSQVTVHGKGRQAPVTVTSNTTTIIGSYPASDKSRSGASPYGVEEMAGNVWEWTSSGFKPYPYTPSDGREDRKSGGDRTLRGGSWYVVSESVRAARRNGFLPDGLSADIGFRVVRASPDP